MVELEHHEVVLAAVDAPRGAQRRVDEREIASDLLPEPCTTRPARRSAGGGSSRTAPRIRRAPR
jgi:hypothetical protein